MQKCKKTATISVAAKPEKNQQDNARNQKLLETATISAVADTSENTKKATTQKNAAITAASQT